MKVVYTVITGDYDDIKSVMCIEPDLDYFCFTNFEFEGKVPKPWTHIKLPPSKYSNKDLARFCKLNPHLILPQYRQSLWVDGNITIINRVSDLINSALSSYKIAAYEHWYRDSTEQEFLACATYGFDFAWKLKKQWKTYTENGYLASQFFENNVLFRSHMDSNIIKMNDFWWQEYLEGGKRDQYSFTYSAYRTNVQIFSLGEHDPRIHQKYFSYMNHKPRKKNYKKFGVKLINRIYICMTNWKVKLPKGKNLLQ